MAAARAREVIRARGENSPRSQRQNTVAAEKCDDSLGKSPPRCCVTRRARRRVSASRTSRAGPLVRSGRENIKGASITTPHVAALRDGNGARAKGSERGRRGRQTARRREWEGENRQAAGSGRLGGGDIEGSWFGGGYMWVSAGRDKEIFRARQQNTILPPAVPPRDGCRDELRDREHFTVAMQMDPTTLQLIQVLERTVSSGECRETELPPPCPSCRRDVTHDTGPPFLPGRLFSRNLARRTMERDLSAPCSRARKTISRKWVRRAATCVRVCAHVVPSFRRICRNVHNVAVRRGLAGSHRAFLAVALAVDADGWDREPARSTATRDNRMLWRTVARRFVRRGKTIVSRDGCSRPHVAARRYASSSASYSSNLYNSIRRSPVPRRSRAKIKCVRSVRR